MGERDVDARVEELTGGLWRLAAGLLQAAAEHPDAVRAGELAAAARVLTDDVLARLDGMTDGTASVYRGEREVRDAVPPAGTVAGESGTALHHLMELYLKDYNPWLRGQPVMIDPTLAYEQWGHLHRVRYGRGKRFLRAPLWNDPVPSRGKRVVRGITSKAEVLRRMHHSYVLQDDLDTPEGELALQVSRGCKAILDSHVIRDGDVVDTAELERTLEAAQWRALVIAAGQGERARERLLTRLDQMEVLAAAVWELDTVFRQRTTAPSADGRIAEAAEGVKEVLRTWPPKAAR